jgi:DNA-directed RNA polymerase specialized sigma24 family protein
LKLLNSKALRLRLEGFFCLSCIPANSKKDSSRSARDAEHTAPPRILSAATNGGFVPATDDKTWLAFRAESTSPLSRKKIMCGLKRRDAPVTSGPTCRCLLCRIETQLADERASSIATYNTIRGSAANGLYAFASPFHLLSHLKATPAGPSSDDLFRELLAACAVEPQFVERLMIVAFIPVLHGTVRRIAQQQSRLERADITQQALSVFLQVLRSEQIKKRQSHFAFAISRAVKRHLFEWAGREGAVHGPGRGKEQQAPLSLADDEFMERHAVLRHFLHRCIAKGFLGNAELDLLIQIKLDGNTGEEIARSNSITSNAVRQRMKRLLAKLRRIAGTGGLRSSKSMIVAARRPVGTRATHFSSLPLNG